MFWSNRRATELASRYENVSIHPTAEVAEDVEIGPFSVIGPECRIDAGSCLHNHTTLHANVHLGRKCEIYPGSVLGGLPQDKKYRGEESRLVLGDYNVLRENVTIHSGTELGNGLTILGHRNLIMANCHIAHDCVLENDIIMANNVLLGGHVLVESYASFGGLAAVHHFVTVGQHAFVGGLTRVTQDVPPYMLLEGNPGRIWSTNKVGLKRRHFELEAINALKVAHRLLFRSRKPRSEIVQELLELYTDLTEVHILIDFLRATDLGHQGRARQPRSHDLEEDRGSMAETPELTD